ncbi:MAG: glutamate racemase [Anaerolineae bacterium]|nr:glutamate racemase [Anaerolineae bacterium]MDW8098854.1 glutamate racemase [Anaerolineae bacterium]
MHRWIASFDSGVGGLSVWREVVRLLPDQPLLYLADQAHCPYGPRPLEEIRRIAQAVVAWLVDQGAGLVVVACNTASAAALYDLRERFPIPIVGMEPAIKPAAQRTRSGKVGVLATPATFQGEPYARLLARYAQGVEVISQPCAGWVEWVEAGRLDDPATMELVERYVEPLRAAGVDELVLGCTHYSFLRPWIERAAGPAIDVIDPAPAVAQQVQRVWSKTMEHLGSVSRAYRFVTTGEAVRFQAQVQQLIGWEGTAEAARWHNGRLISP